ncbi:glutathione S-transferase [Acinetobacter sp.]|uniref:glutathione S-transferase family protein n=1 Tax=Acinetobacter sp. TaxID=472 RepID=UPI0031D04966
MRILYQFPLSHYCEKARWLLDYKELDYIAQNLTPGLHQAFARLKTGQNHLPILKDETHWVATSTAIAVHLDQHYPEHLLLGSTLSTREKILEVDLLCNELGQHVWQWLLTDLLQQDEAIETVLGENGYLRKFSRYSKPVIKTIMAKGFHLNDENRKGVSKKIQQIAQTLNQQFLSSTGCMVNSRFSLADIAVCSMLAPLLNIEGTPWELESSIHIHAETLALKNFLLDLPLGQYVVQTYVTHRNARVDWRGV